MLPSAGRKDVPGYILSAPSFGALLALSPYAVDRTY